MQNIDDDAIMERAQDFCSQNGTSWEELTDYNRKRYLARAREQLLDEETSELISHGLFRDPETGDVTLFSLAETQASEESTVMVEPQPMHR